MKCNVMRWDDEITKIESHSHVTTNIHTYIHARGQEQFKKVSLVSENHLAF